MSERRGFTANKIPIPIIYVGFWHAVLYYLLLHTTNKNLNIQGSW